MGQEVSEINMNKQYLSSAIQIEPIDFCRQNLCGSNSQCMVKNDVAICACSFGSIGNVPGCRPECVVSSHCPFDKACVNEKCVNPCSDTCGKDAECRVNNHSPYCACRNGYTGDPFTECSPIRMSPFLISCFLKS